MRHVLRGVIEQGLDPKKAHTLKKGEKYFTPPVAVELVETQPMKLLDEVEIISAFVEPVEESKPEVVVAEEKSAIEVAPTEVVEPVTIAVETPVEIAVPSIEPKPEDSPKPKFGKKVGSKPTAV